MHGGMNQDHHWRGRYGAVYHRIVRSVKVSWREDIVEGKEKEKEKRLYKELEGSAQVHKS